MWGYVCCVVVVLLHLLSTNTSAQDLSVLCYDTSLEENGCAPANQINGSQSYSDCCVVSDGESIHEHSYLDLTHHLCFLCGPVLDESQLFLLVSDHDQSIISIHWALHSHSLPATHFTLSVEGGEEGVTTLSISSNSSSGRHQFSPVVPGHVYTISVRASIQSLGVISPPVSITWRAGDSIYIIFGNFTVSLLSNSPTGSVEASFAVLEPGLRPLLHLTVRWVELASISVRDDLSDPTSSAYPTTNIVVMQYDITTRDVRQHDIIRVRLGGVAINETYIVAVTGTSIIGSKTNFFIFTAEDNGTVSESDTSRATEISNGMTSAYIIITSFLSVISLIQYNI